MKVSADCGGASLRVRPGTQPWIQSADAVTYRSEGAPRADVCVAQVYSVVVR